MEIDDTGSAALVRSGITPRQAIAAGLEFGRYAACSALALAVDYSLLVTLTEYMALHYMASSAIGFSAGVSLAYVLSIRFVFEQRRLEGSLEFVSFVAIGVLGLLLNQVFLWCLVTFSSLSYALAKAPTAVIVFVFNFSARRSFLFSAAP
jgi:putative flippase GtrA